MDYVERMRLLIPYRTAAFTVPEMIDIYDKIQLFPNGVIPLLVCDVLGEIGTAYGNKPLGKSALNKQEKFFEYINKTFGFPMDKIRNHLFNYTILDLIYAIHKYHLYDSSKKV